MENHMWNSILVEECVQKRQKTVTDILWFGNSWLPGGNNWNGFTSHKVKIIVPHRGIMAETDEQCGSQMMYWEASWKILEVLLLRDQTWRRGTVFATIHTFCSVGWFKMLSFCFKVSQIYLNLFGSSLMCNSSEYWEIILFSSGPKS